MSVNLLLIRSKFPHNVGSAVRAASCYGAEHVYFTGSRFDVGSLKRLPREERMKGYAPWTDLGTHVRPIDEVIGDRDMTPVAVELLPGSEPLHTFEHPENALYVFGPEDGSIPRGTRGVCHRFVHIPSLHCLNLSSATYIVLYDRMVKRVAAGLEDPLSVDGESRGYWHSPTLEAL